MSNPKNSFRKKTFIAPDEFRKPTQRLAEEFDAKKNSYALDFLKLKKGDTPNLVRILPAKDDGSFHLKIGRHFIRHEDSWEVFVCSLETYGKPCPACEKFNELHKTDKQVAAAFKPQIRGVFNAIDRNDIEAGVKLWETAASQIWRKVIEWFKGNTKYNNIVGTVENPLEGRDLNIIYKPDEDIANIYNIWPDNTTQLGTPEQVEKWFEEVKPLVAEKLYPETPYDVARIKTFGSPQEREKLRQALREAYQEAEEEVEEEEEESETVKALKKQLAESNMKTKVAESKIAALERKSPEEEKIESAAIARAVKEEEEDIEEEDPEVIELREKLAAAEEAKNAAEAKADALKKLRDPKGKKDSTTPEETLAKVKAIREKLSENK